MGWLTDHGRRNNEHVHSTAIGNVKGHRSKPSITRPSRNILRISWNKDRMSLIFLSQRSKVHDVSKRRQKTPKCRRLQSRHKSAQVGNGMIDYGRRNIEHVNSTAIGNLKAIVADQYHQTLSKCYEDNLEQGQNGLYFLSQKSKITERPKRRQKTPNCRILQSRHN